MDTNLESVTVSMRSPSPVGSAIEEMASMASMAASIRLRSVVSPPDESSASSSTAMTSLNSFSVSNSNDAANAKLLQGARSSKRSSSTSNDLIYERDRFRARLHTFNNSIGVDDGCDECEVCDEVGGKTAKLMFDRDNLEPSTEAITTPISEIITMSPLEDVKYLSSLTPIPSSTESIKILPLTHKCLRDIFTWYFNQPLPATDLMFPWLHGLHRDNFAQRQFFIYQHQQQERKRSKNKPVTAQNTHHDIFTYLDISQKPEGVRFLMCVDASPKGATNCEDYPIHPILRNTVTPSEILLPIDISRVEVRELIRLLVLKIFLEEEISDELVDLFVADCLKVNHLPTFLNLDPDNGVSLRNFHIQVAKLAGFADLVVYESQHVVNEPNDDAVSDSQQLSHSSPSLTAQTDSGIKVSSSAASLCRILWLAQQNEAYIQYQKSPYNVFVLEETTDVLLKKYDSLFTVKPCNTTLPPGLLSNKHAHPSEIIQDPRVMDCFGIWDGDYQMKEGLERTRMSCASRVFKNVWVGNVWDSKLIEQMNDLEQPDAKKSTIDSTESIPKDVDSYYHPKHSLISPDHIHHNHNLVALTKTPANFRLLIHCHENASFPDLSTLSSLLFQATISSRLSPDDEPPITIDFPPSGSVGLGNCKVDNFMSIVNLCKLLYLFSSSTSKLQLVLLSLVYCSDGFTELSLIVLCYLIYATAIPLDQAMLKLHLEFGRPFYIFNSDVQILRKLEPLLIKLSPVTLGDKIIWSDMELLTNQQVSELLLNGTTGKPIRNSLRLGYIGNDDDSEDDSEDEVKSDGPEEKEKGGTSTDDKLSFFKDPSYQSTWVEDVEGSLPSRILPYLYLGSLKHANNTTLLTSLSISHIISVGEQLDWLNGYKFKARHDIEMQEFDDGNIEIYSITPKDSKSGRNTVQKVMKVKNLQDDGIDELSSSLPTILQFMEDIYQKSNGEEKILIHCRVGVSRSATVVIAEVMRRLELDLPKAYLYVRVRRLNIVIQPNLRFMYELFKWEEDMKRKKQRESKVLTTSTDLREIDWFVMCREIMRLNIRYLNG